MAVRRCRLWPMATFISLLIVACAIVRGVSTEETSFGMVQEFAHTMKDYLFATNRDHKKVSMDSTVENLLMQSYRHTVQDFRKLQGSEVVNKMASRLSEMFSKKVTALRRLKAKAEESIVKHPYNPAIRQEDVSYFDMKNPINVSSFELDPRFGRSVSHEMSGVHIPLPIFIGGRPILNGLLWSSELDSVFQENMKEDKQLSWQYFGSHHGFLRVYPANQWRDLAPRVDINLPPADLFDVRRRPWYIQGITSPKDILVLMDVSGSVHGQTLDILKSSVRALLETLEENDYVHVAAFSSQVTPISCLTSFVQANSRNKRALAAALSLESLKAENTTNYAAALEYAFEMFQNFTESKRPYEGAECHQAIMFFTDGGTDSADAILAKHNPNGEIRIFTYAVGPHSVPTHVLREMACKGRGYFESVHAQGTVSRAAQRYPSILARPMALFDGDSETISAAYTDAGGLGLVVSVTLPVYNRSIYGNNQTTVGIVGTDVPMKDLATVLPLNQTGPNSYAFIINANGFLVLHPKMSASESYLENAPDVDMLDVERDDPSQEHYLDMLRNDMIDGNPGSKQYRTFVNAGDSNHVCQKNVTYHYAPIEGTPLRLSIVIPDDRQGYISPFGKDDSNIKAVQEELAAYDWNLLKEEGMLIAPWEFCAGVHPLGDISALEKKLRNTSIANCDLALLKRLVMDVDRSHGVQQYMKMKLKSQEMRAAIFIGMEGGLTRVFPSNQSAYFNQARDPLKATYFRKALHYTNWVFSVSDEIKGPEPTVTAVKAITINGNRGVNYKPAVYGVQFRESGMWNLIQNISNCSDPDRLSCYLLDDGGYIITSNSESHKHLSGHFLGEEDAILMSSLVNHSLYKRHLEYDYHATCSRAKHSSSSAPRSRSIMNSLLHMLVHLLFDVATWLTLAPSSSSASASSELPISVSSGNVYNVTCMKVRALYYFTPAQNEGNDEGEMTCGNCTRKFKVAWVPSTNLLLVLATPRDYCGDTCTEPQLSLQHKPEETDGPNVCDMKPRYRRRPETCYANHTAEDTSICSSADLPWIPGTGTFGTLLFLLGMMWKF